MSLGKFHFHNRQRSPRGTAPRLGLRNIHVITHSGINTMPNDDYIATDTRNIPCVVLGSIRRPNGSPRSDKSSIASYETRFGGGLSQPRRLPSRPLPREATPSRLPEVRAWGGRP